MTGAVRGPGTSQEAQSAPRRYRSGLAALAGIMVLLLLAAACSPSAAPTLPLTPRPVEPAQPGPAPDATPTLVPGPGAGSAPATADPPSPQATDGANGCRPGQVNINTASSQELSRIVAVGTSRADDVIRHRPYNSLDDLERLPGISKARITDIRRQGVACVE